MTYFKQMLKSKLVWLGLAQIVTAVGLYATSEASLFEMLFGATGIMTILLRLYTTQAISDK